MVSATVSGITRYLDKTYEARKISEALDFINIKSFDFNPKNNIFALHHSDTNPGGLSYDDNVLESINGWLKRGVHSRKIVMGISASGKSYTLRRAKNWQIGSPVDGAGKEGKYTQQKGLLAYYEICQTRWVKHICTDSSKAKAPFGTDGVDFFAYDDPQSVQYKVENVMLKLNLRGFMISDLDLDDFDNVCGAGSYSLLKAGRNAARSIDNLRFSCLDILVSEVLPITTSTTTSTETPNEETLQPTKSEVTPDVKVTKEDVDLKTTTKSTIKNGENDDNTDPAIDTDLGIQGQRSQSTRSMAGYSLFVILLFHVCYYAMLLL